MSSGADADDVLAAGGFARHGGRLSAAEARFPAAPRPWLDLSTGINPWSYPAPRAGRAERARLPEIAALRRLEALAAQAFGVQAPERVIAVPGTEAALRLLPDVVGADSAVIAAPTYGSHADAWLQAGVSVASASDAELAARAALRCAMIVVNPNNPDGRSADPAMLLDLHDVLRAHDGTLIVDEAFGEVAPCVSVAAPAGSPRAPRLVVLRSFGKFYGLAGVRLGFIVCAPALGRALRSRLGDWPVSADAIAAGLAAYADTEWAVHMRARLTRAARRLDGMLCQAGFEVVGGTSLYRLARAGNSLQRFARLAAAGILVRPFDHDETLLRFGLPGPRAGWQRLAGALESLQ